jgi:hypothetical protein
MMPRVVPVLLVAAALAGCGTRPYVPKEYPLRDGLIPKLAVNGQVQVRNAQPSTDEAIVHSYAAKLASNYKDITQLMVDQTSKEIAKNGTVSSSGKAKAIDLKVTYLQSTYIAFYWKSELKYNATLGTSGATFEKTVTHSTGGGVYQDLNGCIAEAVMNLLQDPRVIGYLAE